jgi:hypothetical protein
LSLHASPWMLRLCKLTTSSAACLKRQPSMLHMVKVQGQLVLLLLKIGA